MAPPPVKANPVPEVMVAGGGMVGVGGGFVAAVGKLVANAGAKRLVGAPGVGVMPVTVPVLAPTLVTAVPVFGVTLVIALVEGVVRLVPEVKNVPGGPTATFVTTVCGGATVPLTTGTVSSVTSGVFIWLTN